MAGGWSGFFGVGLGASAGLGAATLGFGGVFLVAASVVVDLVFASVVGFFAEVCLVEVSPSCFLLDVFLDSFDLDVSVSLGFFFC